MKEPSIDPERLAAFIDGRVREPERSALLKQIASSDQAFDALVDASAVLAEIESPGRAASSGSRQHRVFARWKPMKLVVTAAASLLVVAAVHSVLTRGPNASTHADPRRLALVAPASRSLDSGFYRTALWPATRGASIPLRPDARAVRLGVRLADLQLSGSASTAIGQTPASDIAAMLDGVAGAAAAAATFRDLSSRASAGDTLFGATIERARDDLVRFADAELLDAGFALEMTRAAAAERNAVFFADRTTEAILARIAALPAVRRQAPNDANRLHAQAGPTSKPDWEQVERIASNLIRLLAS